jgi:hypothetical protein
LTVEEAGGNEFEVEIFSDFPSSKRFSNFLHLKVELEKGREKEIILKIRQDYSDDENSKPIKKSFNHKEAVVCLNKNNFENLLEISDSIICLVEETQTSRKEFHSILEKEIKNNSNTKEILSRVRETIILIKDEKNRKEEEQERRNSISSCKKNLNCNRNYQPYIPFVILFSTIFLFTIDKISKNLKKK